MNKKAEVYKKFLEENKINWGDVFEVPKADDVPEESFMHPVVFRHLTLTRFINEVLGVDETIAEKDACRIEHIISPETFAGIKGMLKD